MSYGSIASCYFKTKNGREYTIVKTEYGNGKDVMNAIDTLINQEGKRKKMRRAKTLKLIKS